MTELTAGAPAGWRDLALRHARRLQVQAVKIYRSAKSWRVHLALPAAAGVSLLSASAGMRFGAWAGLGVAGVFLLRLDSRIG